jgi:colanic acid/amylovoran biosynthesis protein
MTNLNNLADANVKVVYLTGQNNFGNRGCEALVRSTIFLLRKHLGDVRFLVPSLDIPRDSAQWPEAAEHGVTFVPAPVEPPSYRTRGRLCRVLPFMKSFMWPSLKNLPNLEKYLQQADAVVSIGGDNISLDYGLPSLFFFVQVAERALELGKKVALWGASVGPFSAEPQVERLLAAHLQRLDMVSVRESHSINYLKSIGVSANVVPVSDSAFVLERQKVDLTSFWPADEHGVLGLNVSPLIETVYAKSGRPGSVKSVTADFIRRVLKETQMSVLLIPHVAPLNGAAFNNDELYMKEILREVPEAGERLKIAPAGLNCCQLKEIIAHCRFLIGARTHATLAALSSGVPTISIAYSIKARGINRDLLGNEDCVLATPDMSVEALHKAFTLLLTQEQALRQTLQTRVPLARQQVHAGAEFFSAKIRAESAVAA